VTAAAVIDLRNGRRWRLAGKLRTEDGVGLVELLIALLVLNVGIFATLGAFTSAATTIRRASHVSTAAAVGDRYMECFRNAPYASIQWPLTSGSCTATSVTGPDGRQYNLSATIATGSQLTTGTYRGSTSVKVVTLTVSDPGDNNKVLVTSTSTFSRCGQSGLGTDTGNTPCQS
jgi:Tfp pilus assembly protein PilV